MRDSFNNVYVVVVLANVFLTLGNVWLGKKFGTIHIFNLLLILWSGKIAVGAVCYPFGTMSMTELPKTVILGVFVIGLILGLGELFLFRGLMLDTAIVAALGCLYPLLIMAWSWVFTREVPEPRYILAILLSAAAIYVSAPRATP